MAGFCVPFSSAYLYVPAKDTGQRDWLFWRDPGRCCRSVRGPADFLVFIAPLAKTRDSGSPATLQCGYFVFGYFVLAARGVYTEQLLISFLVALPVGLASAYAGLLIFKRLETDSFRRLLIILMLVSGCVLLVRTLV